jgi:hypothetical protein
LGPRALTEFLLELGAEQLIRTDLELRLERYASRLSPEVLRAAGADRIGTVVHLVAGDGERVR